MKRRTLLSLFAASPFLSVNSLSVSAETEIPPVTYSVDDWRRLLSPESFRILFEEATEPRYTSPLNKEERDGTFYLCRLLLATFLQ